MEIAPDLVDLSSNTNILGPCRGAVEAAFHELGRSNQYPERQSHALLDALASHHGVDASQILTGNGAHHVLRIAAQTFLKPGDITVGLTPTYPTYRKAASVMGANFRSVPAANGGYETERWVDAVADARLIWLCTPNNPTGCILTQVVARRIIEAMPEGGVAVFDQTYLDFADEPDAANGITFLREGADVIVVHTFSKLFGLAGLRIGYAIAKSKHIALMLGRLDAFPVNRVGQAAAVAALQDVAHQTESRNYILRGRQQLETGLGRLGVEFFRSQGNFVTAYFGESSARVLRSVKEAGYKICEMDGDWELPGWLRITVGLPSHNADVLRAIEGSLKGDPGEGRSQRFEDRYEVH